MNKTKTLIIRITPEQEKILLAKARSSGFLRKSEYVRSVLFRSTSFEEKINKLLEKVFENE